MKCPKCGYRRRNSDNEFVPSDECPACGIVYSKHMADAPETDAAGTSNSEPMLKPSPVDAESLKKARERVERRLNERLAEQKRDARRDQTLELARQLASEGVRQRQEQWKQKQASGPDPMNTPEADEEALSPTQSPPDDTATPQAMPDEPEQVAAAVSADPPSDDQMDQDLSGAFTDDDTVLIMETDTHDNAPTSWPATSDQQPPAISDPVPGREDTAPAPQAENLTTASAPSNRRTRRRWFPKWGMSRLLPLVAWLILIAGISGAILSWTTLTEAEANIPPHAIVVGPSMDVGLLLGFAYLVTGVLGFAFFWVSSLINRQLKDIRRLLLLQPLPLGHPAKTRDLETIEDLAATSGVRPTSAK